MSIGRNEEFCSSLILVFIHKDRLLYSISDLKKLIKRVNLNNLISVEIEFGINLLNMRLILRKYLTDLSVIRYILRSRQVHKCYKQRNKQGVNYTEYNGGNLEYFLCRATRNSNKLFISNGHTCRHLNVYSLIRKRYIKRYNVIVDRLCSKRRAHTVYLDMKLYYKCALDVGEIVGRNEFFGKIVIHSVIQNNKLVYGKRLICTVSLSVALRERIYGIKYCLIRITVDYLKLGLGLIGILVVNVLRIRHKIVFEVCYNIVYQRCNVGLILAKILAVIKLIGQKLHLIIDVTRLGVFRVISFTDISKSNNGDKEQNRHHNYGGNYVRYPALSVSPISVTKFSLGL